MGLEQELSPVSETNDVSRRQSDATLSLAAIAQDHRLEQLDPGILIAGWGFTIGDGLTGSVHIFTWCWLFLVAVCLVRVGVSWGCCCVSRWWLVVGGVWVIVGV